MKEKIGAKPKTLQTKWKDASTQTDRYVEHMPFPIIVDVKSEDDSSGQHDVWHDEEEYGSNDMLNTIKIEFDEPQEYDEAHSRSFESYLPPIEQLYFEDKESIAMAVMQPIVPVSEMQKQPPIKAEKTPRKRKPKQENASSNGPKPKKPRKPKPESAQRQLNTSTELKLVECSLCKFTCKRPSHLKRHMLMHTGERPHQCEHCPKSFAQKTDLNRHMGAHASLYNFHCGNCGRGFPTDIESKKHESNCKTKRYICDQCQYMTFSVGNLLLHQRKHTGERPFACDVCDKRFTRVAHLNQHVKLHAEDFDYHCSMCGRGFSDVNEMQRHQSNCKNRQFQCHICKDPHYRMDNLKRHIKSTHTGEKEILCEYCSKQFPTNSSLKKHIQQRHADRL